MTVRGNFLSEGSSSVRSDDLLSLLSMAKHLPWLYDLLAEIEYLRARKPVSDGERNQTALEIENEELVALLAKLGVKR